MAARKKRSTRKRSSRKAPSSRASRRKTARRRWNPRDALEEGLRDLEQRLPANLRGAVRDLRANLKSVQAQLEKMRRDREERWHRIETQLRRDIANLLRRLEKAVAPRSGGRSAARKAPRRKTSTRKKTARR